MTDDTKSKTITKTLWTETALEILLVALSKDRPDADVKAALKDLRDLKKKKFTRDYIIGKVRKELGDSYADRVARLTK